MKQRSVVRRNFWRASLVLLAGLVCSIAVATRFARAQTPPASSMEKDQPYEVEYYYKARWGYAEEWLRLFKKNHLPVLRALKEQGRIVELEMERPRYHATEDGRWDYRVTITWKNFAASSAPPAEERILQQKLFPDQETFQREEQRRFEILLAHWDLPIVEEKIEP